METRAVFETASTGLQSAFAPCVRVIGSSHRESNPSPVLGKDECFRNTLAALERILGIEPSKAQLGRLAPHQEDTRKWSSLVTPLQKSRCFRDYRSPRSESNRTRLDTNEVHGHRATWASAPRRNSAAMLCRTDLKTPPVARLRIRFAALRCGSSTYPSGTPRRRALVCSRLLGGLGPGF